MEWREQSAVSCEEGFEEAQRWIEAVTKKKFGSNDFRSALENGVLLCDLINRIKPGVIRKINRLPTPIAGLDNLNVFLKACGKLGLKEAQLFHPGDLQDLSSRVTVKDQETNRRLKNVLITVYWLGRRAQSDRLYDGPYLNFKAFEGLLGTALYKALHESSKGSNVRDSGFGESWYSEREELHGLREEEGGGGGGHRRDDSLDSLDSLGSRPHSTSSDTTLKGSSEGCCSDTEVDSVFKMAENRDTSYRRSVSITPKASAAFNQFLPTKDKPSGYVPAPLRKKRAERSDDNRRSWTTAPYSEEEEGSLTRPSPDWYDNSQVSQSALPATPLQSAYEYESGSDSDSDRPDPDLVLDDLASRRFHSPSPAPPTNFAVPVSPVAAGRASGGRGGPWPEVPMSPSVVPAQSLTFLSSGEKQRGSVRVEHRRAVSADSLFREIYDDSEDEDNEEGYADPVQDDLYARKMGLKPHAAAGVSHDKFLPKFWTPEEDVHVQKIKLGSQRRPWYKKMQGFRPLETQESIDGSKSTSDIHTDPTVSRQARYEELQKYREKTKESDDQWQDDLSKWKNRRRSVNSDIVKKKEERERIEQITHSDSNRRSKTFKEMQEERANKRNSVGSSFRFLTDDDEAVFDEPVRSPRTHTLPARSFTIDTPYSSFEPSLREEEPPAASPAPGRAAPPPAPEEEDSVDHPAGRDSSTTSRIPPSIPPRITPRSVRSLQPAAADPDQKNPAPEFRTVQTQDTSSSSLPKVPAPRRSFLASQTAVEAPSSGSLFKQQPQTGSMEPKPPGTARVSASLPRSYQRLDSARITSVVTPRPFGTQSTRIASLSRASTTDESLKRVNGDVDVSKKSSVPSRYQQFMTSEDEAQSQSSSSHSSEDEEEEEEESMTAPKSIPSTKSVSPDPPQLRSQIPISPAPAKETSTEDFCDMRISLNQKPNSSRDFGFQAVWDSTGARVTSIQPGSSAQMCQLQVGDEVLAVNKQQVADMSYTDWKSSLEEALQEGSLVMDIRRHGKNRSPENIVSPSLDLTSRSSPEKLTSKEAAVHPVIDVASNGVNGGFLKESVTMRNKESEPISMKNLKRRSEFFEQGGSESVMPDIPVPALTPSSSRWSWDPEEERRRQEKWQKEQERLLQEKYKRDQEKLQEEWHKAQEEISKSRDQQQPGSLSTHSPISHAVSPPWEEEERKRKEEQERQRQAEERRKREEEERELQRLQEERKRREREAEEERKRREREAEEERERREREAEEERMKREREAEEERKRSEREAEEERKRRGEELRLQRRREEEREEELRQQRRREQEREEERRQQEAWEQQQRERQRASEQQWSAGSHLSVQSALSSADRTKSKSSPQLDEEDRPQRRGVHVQPGGGMAHWLLEEQLRSLHDKQVQIERAASELELERRSILNAMRYREPERVSSSGALDRKGQPLSSQAEAERQQILNEMKKKTPLLTDSSWIRQRASQPPVSRDPDMPPMRRGESLDHLDSSYNSWRSSGTARSSTSIPNYARPHSALSGSVNSFQGWSGAQRPGSSTLPSSYSMGSLRGGAGTPTAPWSRQSTSPSPSFSSPSPTTSPEPTSESGAQPSSRSVSGKKICTFCDSPLGKGAAMIIESLGLCYHLGCFKCIDCKSDLGGSQAGAEVRIRNKQLYCNSCYMRFKTGQPTSM